MHRPRFVFLAVPPDDQRIPGDSIDAIIWMLASSNNRLLGRGGNSFATYLSCRDAVLRLRESRDRIESQSSVVEETGQWMWRVDLDGRTVAVSSRSYLRMRECRYNLDRFLDAVPRAEVVNEVRSARSRGRTVDATAVHVSFGVH